MEVAVVDDIRAEAELLTKYLEDFSGYLRRTFMYPRLIMGRDS